MTNFEVVYTYDPDKDWVLISKVYAVDNDRFLLVDAVGKFIWAPMQDCVLEDRYSTYTNEREEAREVVKTFHNYRHEAVVAKVSKVIDKIKEGQERLRDQGENGIW